MRALVLSALVLLLAGCSLFGEDRVREAVVVNATLEALPLGLPWDRQPPNTDPDVYVDVRKVSPSLGESSLFRSVVVDDVRASALPLTLRPAAGRPIPIEEPVLITVADRDAGTFFDSDDEMFRADSVRFETLLRPEDRPGTGRTLVFEDGATRLLVRVEWR